MSIDAGKLDSRLEIQRDANLDDDTKVNEMGERVEDWQAIYTVWGSIEPISGRELWLAQQAKSEATHKITIRYRDDLKSSDRVVKGSRTFYLIEPPREIGRGEHLEFLVKETP